MDLDKTLHEWSNMLRKRGFNVFTFTDGQEVIFLEISVKNFKASLWKDLDKLFLFIPFPSAVKKEIADRLESDFLKIAENKIKKLLSTDSKLTDLSSLIKPKPLYMEHDVMGMRVDMNRVEDVIFLLKKFDDAYEKANSNV
jgi:hypothetical protein